MGPGPIQMVAVIGYLLSMKQQYLFDPIPCDKYDLLSKEEVVGLAKDQADLIRQMQNALKDAHDKLLAGEQKSFSLGEQLCKIKNKLFGKSSEKSPRNNKKSKDKKEAKKRVRLPSERYKNLDIVEKDVTLDNLPECPCCQSQMQDSKLFESSEYLTFIPRQYYVVREKRRKYRCKTCQGALITAPAIPRLIPGGAYSDEMIIDVALSKFLDLLPIERYTQIAAREGLSELPANSLINTTHKLADCIGASYKLIKEEVFESEVIHADETLHRMLEGDKRSNWYLWGFSNGSASYFEVRDTRSGDVASDLLKGSNCKYLMSDVFSGYKKAVRQANEGREEKIVSLYCNAHARRKFNDSKNNFEKESNFFIKLYQRIYRLEDLEYKVDLTAIQKRSWQKLYMRVMEKEALRIKSSYSSKLSITKALNYFINNFDSLIKFTEDPELPIDNNPQERQMRTPVVGRKTWYGTHSKRGGKTTAIMFSIVESCKLNKINPREYVTDLVRALHQGMPAFSPKQYRLSKESEKEKDVD